MLRTLRALTSNLITEIRRLDRCITATATEITTAVQDSGSTLTQLHGIGNLLAGKVLARVGDISRFRSAAAFAAFNGTAPIEVSPGDIVPQASAARETANSTPACTPVAIAQICHDTPAAPITNANAPLGQATEKHYDA
jgi:transposase